MSQTLRSKEGGVGVVREDVWSPPKFSNNLPFFVKEPFKHAFFWKYLIWNSKYSVVLRMSWVKLTISEL